MLILSTHPDCNGAYAPQDQQIGQLVGMLHRRRFPAGQRKLAIHEIGGDDGEIRALLSGTPLPAIIRRWVRGFHAALYREYLPEREDSFITIPPLTAAVGSAPRPQPQIAPRLTSVLRQARRLRKIDTIQIRNGTCRYQCVWAPWSGSEWGCVYQLDLYNWSDLGDPRLPSTRCMGFYRAVGSNPPSGAATMESLDT